MKGLLDVLHPTFDSLSAYADLGELDGLRSRVGRHVARCGQCRDAVAEIRALGAAARESDTEGAPSGLWLRIESHALKASTADASPLETPPPDAVPWDVAPSLRPTRLWPVPTKRAAVRVLGGLAVAAAALVAVALATGRPPSLLASAPSRITMTPFRPAPGTTVHVHYDPTPKLAGFDQLVLLGQFLTDPASERMDYYFGGQYDSLATLRRAPDGALVGDFTVPSDFKAASLVVIEPRGRVYEGDGLHSWVLVGGDARGRPVLASLLTALSLSGLYDSPGRASVLDTLQRYFPEHPAGFATAKRYRGEGMFADMLKFFRGAERKYVQFNSKLEKQPALDADRLSAMIQFGYDIEEPAEAAKWTRRLVREHPADPRALLAYAQMVHAVELKEPPADTIRRYLPLLDTLLMRNVRDTRTNLSEAYSLVRQYGDSAMQRRWALRALRQMASVGSVNPGIEDRWLRDREIREATRRVVRAGLVAQPSEPRWLARGWLSEQQRTRYCLGKQAAGLGTLSKVAMLNGQLAEASALADSAVAIVDTAGTCQTARAHQARGDARLARGDTVGAARDFAIAFAGDNWRSIDARKAMAIRLGASVDAGRWAAFEAEARADRSRCLTSALVRDSLERLLR